MTPTDDHLRLAEALLFAASEPLDEATIAARFPEGTDVSAVLVRLQEVYSQRGVNVVRVAGRWAMRTAPDLAGALRIETHVPRKLSRAAVETLSIIAYHQPVTRAEVEEVRGVALSRGTLETLMEAGWVQPKGRRQVPGRPVTWVTTPKFLEQFGLDTLADLPGLDELKAAGLLDPRPAMPEPAEPADEDGEGDGAAAGDDTEQGDGDAEPPRAAAAQGPGE